MLYVFQVLFNWLCYWYVGLQRENWERNEQWQEEDDGEHTGRREQANHHLSITRESKVLVESIWNLGGGVGIGGVYHIQITEGLWAKSTCLIPQPEICNQCITLLILQVLSNLMVRILKFFYRTYRFFPVHERIVIVLWNCTFSFIYCYPSCI